MSSDIAIKVENLNKRYQVYGAPRDRLKQFLVPRIQRIAWTNAQTILLRILGAQGCVDRGQER